MSTPDRLKAIMLLRFRNPVAAGALGIAMQPFLVARLRSGFFIHLPPLIPIN